MAVFKSYPISTLDPYQSSGSYGCLRLIKDMIWKLPYNFYLWLMTGSAGQGLKHFFHNIKGVEQVICDVILRHCINIEASAILQLVSN